MTLVLVGGYGPADGGTAGGIGIARREADGRLRYLGAVAEAASPSWLLVIAEHVYAALEGSDEILALHLRAGRLEPLGAVPVGGAGPCHLGALSDGIAAADYGDGTVSVHGFAAEGPLGALAGPAQVLRLEGSGPHADQAHARAHASLELEDGRLLVADLGADELSSWTRGVGGRWERLGALRLPSGTGPRDLELLADGRVLLLGQIDGTLHLLDTGEDVPALEASVALPGFEPGSHAAGIALDAATDRIHVGIRGVDRVAVLERRGDGLSGIGDVDCGGRWPRHLAVVGGELHVANERSSTISSFRITGDGLPEVLGEPTPAPSPTHLVPVAGRGWEHLAEFARVSESHSA
ncbi:lactonase family protein [Homoserinibacter sp. YIM 151385]|uniref:lactonase family protein n=1 Tax=Homoserinibacter sp. YIM 151385 TaxID=2985506 RepID=UPI0022F0FD61|nr:beta-propeller fold lactonase family protein [Homoserinibacter sp. YIM 151385]WBU38436.1 beta-propeller fold lactonase family protein [Homoserinibacter sp. YIM 151385]